MAILLALCNPAFAHNVTTDLKVAFFVNLDHMPTRRAHMENQLQLAGLQARRWRAVDWQRVARGEFDQDYLKPQGIVPRLFQVPAKEGNGTIGCFLSHVTALIEAAKELGPHDLALIMEDDVAIREDWRFRLQKALDMAPPDWQLLKLSGWGRARAADMVKRSVPAVRASTPSPSMFTQFMQAFSAPETVLFTRSMFDEQDTDVTFFRMREPFAEPAFLNLGTQGYGSPNYFYSGTGAYLVRGSSIQKVIQHLRGRAINDLDAMLLLNGTTHFYEGWPHIFGLSGDASSGPGLHGRKPMDEFDKGSKTDADLTEEPASVLEHTPARGGDSGVQHLAVLSRGVAVEQGRHARVAQTPLRASVVRRNHEV